MDSNPRVLTWNLADAPGWTELLVASGAPAPRAVNTEFGQAFVHELLFETALPGPGLVSAERLVLFFNVEADVIRAVMRAAREAGLARPIYATVTETSIEWRFRDLLEHLVEEREHFNRMEAELAERKPA